jgi:hypothetical protein
MRILSAALLSVAVIAAAEPALAGSVPPPVAETRNCAWQAKIDPYGVNALFPDRAARYWLLQLPAAAGMSLDIHGRFPHSRYISFTTYDPALRSVDGLNDVRIRPDRGSRSPFLPGASRRVPDGQRTYTVHVVQGSRPSRPAANHLYTGSSDGSRSAPYFSVIYRDYEPDRSYGDDGGVGLPSVTVRTPAGAVPLPTCTAPVAPATGLNETVANGSLPVGASGGSTTVPAWHKFYNLPSALAYGADPATGGRGGAVQPFTRSLPQGGFADNPDNKYIAASVSQLTGEVVIIHSRLPTHPRTYQHQAVMQSAQLRYWSLCSNDPITERFYACVIDDEMPVAADGTFTTVVSSTANRPKNATPACGIAWLPLGPGPATVLIERNMLPSPGFRYSIQRARYDHERADLGAYYPTTRYTSVAQAERLGCHRPARDGSR